LQWFSRPYAPTDRAAECECGADIDTNGDPEPLRGSQFVPDSQLLAKRESFTDSGPLVHADAVADSNTDANTESNAESNTDADSNTDARRDRTLDKRGATLDRWIDDQSSRQRVAV
jgi:hypothetical protein